jgi:hypothetical protein
MEKHRAGSQEIDVGEVATQYVDNKTAKHANIRSINYEKNK